MRIFANILRTFKVSSRESCKITNRRYSSQVCPRIRGPCCGEGSQVLNVVCVRSFTTTPSSSKNSGAIDGSPEKSASTSIIPVAFLKADADECPLKILVIPINLFTGDDEAVQKTMSTMTVLKAHADQIDAFADNAAAFSVRRNTRNRKYSSEMMINGSRKMKESLWQDIESESNKLENKQLYDGLDEAISEYEGNSSNCDRHILSDVPKNLEKRLGDAAITSMNLAFEMDMTNIRDALMNHSKTPTVDMMHTHHESLDDPTVKLMTKVESGSASGQETVPLNFNALIHGTVNIDSSKISAEKLEEIEIPQYNDYVTTIAANICSTALQKGFPADISRMYSTSTPETPKRPQSPHVVCVRDGDKGCVSPGNSDLEPYVEKSKRHSTEEPKKREAVCKESATAEQTLLTSTIIGDLGARGLMSCKAYARALQEAARLRELAAAAKKAKEEKKSCAPKDSMEFSTCKKNDNEKCKEDKLSNTTIKPCENVPCGPPKQDSICKGKVLKDPPPKPPLNNPCQQQDPPCRRTESLPPSKQIVDTNVDMPHNHIFASSNAELPSMPPLNNRDVFQGSESLTPNKQTFDSVDMIQNPILAAPDSDTSPCQQQDLSSSIAENLVPNKQVIGSVDMIQDEVLAAPDSDPPCKKMPFKCPPEKKKSHEEKVGEDNDPCRIMYPDRCPPSTGRGSCKMPIIDPCKEQNKCDKEKEPSKPKEPPCKPKNPCKKADALNSQTSTSQNFGKEDSNSILMALSNLCGKNKSAEKKKRANKPPEINLCGAKAKSTAPNCDPTVHGDVGKQAAEGSNPCAEKKSNSKCGKVKAESPKCNGDKNNESSKCNGGKKAESSKCNGEKKAESSKCNREKKAESSKCNGEKKDETLKSSGDKKADPSKCNKEKKSAAPKCNGNKKDAASKCGGEGKNKNGENKTASSKCGGEGKNGGDKTAPLKCVGENKTAPSKSDGDNKAGLTQCGGEKKSEPPKCDGLKRASSSKCDGDKEAEKSRSNGGKSATELKCKSGQNGVANKTAPNCSEEQKNELKKYAEANGEKSKCNAEKGGAVLKCSSENKSGTKLGDKIKAKSKNLCKPPVVKFKPRIPPKEEETTNCEDKESKPTNFCLPDDADTLNCDLLLSSKLNIAEKKMFPRNSLQSYKTFTSCASSKVMHIEDKCSDDSKKQENDSVNSLNTAVIPLRSTKLISFNDRFKFFGTSIWRTFYTAVVPVHPFKITFSNSPLGNVELFSSKKDDKKTASHCPAFPPMPMHRKDKRRTPKDCFLQDHLDNPCYTQPPKDRSKSACFKKPEPKKCWDDDDNENKFRQLQSTLLQRPGRRNNRAMQTRHFTSSCAHGQHEKQTKYDIDESPSNNIKVPKTEIFNGISNEVIKIGAAGEVLQVREKIEALSDYDVLIRVAAIAISGSDIHVYETGAEQCQGMTIGHDATGVVEHVGKCVDRLKPGDCVAMESGLSCGICEICKKGTYNMCPQLFHNGFFSTFQTHPADLCHKIPKNLTMEDATLTSTLALGCHACFRAHITPVTNVLVIGTCPTACAAGLCARALGAKSVAIMSPNVYTLESIRILFDIDYIHYYENEANLVAKVTDRVCSVMKDRPNVVINYSISESTMSLATHLLQPSGTCVLAECDQEHANFNAMDVIMKNITLIPSFRSASMFPTALHLMKSGKTPIGELISRIYTWDQVRWAFHWAQYESNMGNRKVIVQCPENS